MTVKLYVEGGGDSEALHSECRRGFRLFLEKAGLEGYMPRIVACGGRQVAYDRFRTACRANERALLLLDSEMPVADTSPWAFLESRDGFRPPVGVADAQCHLMVVCMESWFLADRKSMNEFFGQGFNEKALPQNITVEAVSKHDVYSGFQRASAGCKTKAPYGKGEHSFKILARVDPRKVCDASPWAKRFLDEVNRFMKEARKR